jgi:ABC-2 type transport system permease protein
MSAPGSFPWFAAHESRLAWRDYSWLLTRGGRRRAGYALLGFLAFVLFLHGVAYLFMTHVRRLTGAGDARELAIVAGMMALTFSAMLSQAMESVTRAFYARGDLELILTSPAKSARLFAVRVAAINATILSSSLIFATPAIDMQAILEGPRWLCAYLVVAALAMLAVALAIAIVSLLFATIGARRTRFAAQIVAAVIGAAFAIGLQFAAIVSFGTMNAPRFAALERWAEDPDAAILWPARAVFGEWAPLATLMGLGLAAMALVIGLYAPHFGRLALAAGSVAQATKKQIRGDWSFSAVSPAQALRRKELSLLTRDPWLLSQTLMQLLYLAPAAFLLWRSFFAESGVATFLSPILIMAAGQLAGGLAWLAVSGEDAPELIATAPVAPAKVLRAKTEAVLLGVAIVFLPLIAMLAVLSPFAALISLFGVAIAACASTAIQYWFRAQAKRSQFRRRQTSSKIATFAEAFSSNGWAGVGAVAVTGSWLAVAPALLVAALLAGVWWVSPARAGAQV